MRRVAQLITTPLKGAALDEPAEIELGPSGVANNRRFYLVDERGQVYNGRQHGPLVRIRADYDVDDRRLMLRFPDGTVVEDVAVGGEERLETDFWGRPVPSRVVDGPFAKALSCYARTPLRLLEAERPGDAVDGYPVTLISSASISELRRRSGGGGDSRRFRMLIELDGCEPHEEETWTGRTVQIGTALVQIKRPVPRCVVTTHSPDTGVRDFDTLRAIVEHRRARAANDRSTPANEQARDDVICLGMYGTVVRPGRVAVGDRAELQAD